MKILVLALATLAFSTCAFAQSAVKATAPVASGAPAAPAPHQRIVTKTEFTTQIGKLDDAIAAGKMDAAKAAWGGVKSMMGAVINNTRMQLAKSSAPADKASVNKASQTQRTLYGEAFRLAQGDLTANRAALHDKLSQFANTITQ